MRVQVYIRRSPHSMRTLNSFGIYSRNGVPRNSVWMYIKTLGFLLCLSTFFVQGASADCTPCPTGCTCTRPDNTLSYCYVDCSNAGLTSVPAESELPNGTVWTVVKLDLSNNSITSLAVNSFSFMTNLQELNLRANNIMFTPGSTFNLSSLHTLDLSQNPLSEFPFDAFDTCRNLVSLNVSHMSLSLLFPFFVQNLDKLETLDISNNRLSMVFQGVFDTNTALRNLNLSYNSIDMLFTDLFSLNTNLTELDISNNNITDIENGTFCESILHLNLKNNSLQTISNDVFATLTALQTLDISENSIGSLDKDVFSPLSSLTSLNIANNPWVCDCTLVEFKNAVLAKETGGTTLVDRNSVQCTTTNTAFLDITDDRFWSCETEKRRRRSANPLCKYGWGSWKCGPTNYVSCSNDPEALEDYNVFFSDTTSLTSNISCQVYCFDLGTDTTHAVFVDSSDICMCGSVVSTATRDCYCSGHSYSDGDTVSCSDGVSFRYVSGVYEISTGLIFDSIPTLTTGISQSFTARTALPNMDQYQWYFDDRSFIEIKTTTNSYYTMTHTYALPGTYTLSVTVCSTSSSVCSNGSVPVIVNVNSADISVTLSCDSYVDVTSKMSLNASFSQGYQTEYVVSRSPPDDKMTSTDGACESSSTFLRGRCLKVGTGTADYTTANSSCTLLSIYHTTELSEVVTAFSGLGSRFLLGATKNGTRYYWSDGTKAYFSTANVTDASLGDCVYIDILSSSLKGTACTTATNFICQSAPVQCSEGGMLYTNGHCYVLKSGTVTWSQASSACEALSSNQARLANIDSSNLETFIFDNVLSGTTQAWVGLSDRQLEGYLLWTNDQTVDGYNPVGTVPTTDCFSLTSSRTWSGISCSTSLQNYICEYSHRGTATVQTYVAGMADIEKSSISYGYNLTSLPTTTAPGSSSGSSITIFPGLWFSHSGYIRSWNFRSKNITQTDVYLKFQVYRPTCTTLLQPGCDGSGSRFASCVTSATTCSASPTCQANKDVCYLTNTCGPVADSCNCVGSTQSHCTIDYVGSRPNYVLVNETTVHVPDGSSNVFKVSVPDGFAVQALDVVAFHTNSPTDVILCETDSSSLSWQQDGNQIISDWISIGDTPSGYTSARNDASCYVQAIYTAAGIESLPDSLSYFTTTGSYTFTLEVPSASLTQTCNVVAQEQVGTINWIHPEFVAGMTNTIYVEHGNPVYLVLSVSEGSHLKANWSIDGVESDFYNSCPADVEALKSTECNAELMWPSTPYTYRQITFSYPDGATRNIRITVYNNLGQSTIDITIKVVYPITGTVLELHTSQANNYVEASSVYNIKTVFLTKVTTGSPTAYAFTINGTSVPSNGANLSHTFTDTGFYTVGVNVSDILNWQYAEINVTGKIKFYGVLQSGTTLPSAILVNVEKTFEISVFGQTGAVLAIKWDYGNSESSTSSLTVPTLTAPYPLSQTYNYTTTGSYILNVTATDEFDVVLGHLWTFKVVDALSSISLTASTTIIEINSVLDLNVTLPSTGYFGDVTYTFDFSDGSSPVTLTSSNIAKTFTSTGIYNITVTVSNVASSGSAFLIVSVEESISGLSLTGNNPALLNASLTYRATTTTGSDINYVFSESTSGQNSGSQTGDSFVFVFTQVGVYNVTVVASNNLNSASVYLLVQVISADTLIIQNITNDLYVVTGTSVAITADVLHHSTTTLSYLWVFGDGGAVQKGLNLSTVTKAYTSPGTYNISLTVEDLTLSIQKQSYSPVTVQDAVTTLTLSNNGPGNITSASPAVVTVTAIVLTGTDVTYVWTSGGTTSTTTINTYSFSYTVVGTETVSVSVSNQVSSLSRSTSFQIRETIEGLSIDCLDCATDSENNTYIAKATMGNFTAVTTLGSDVSYSWIFGDLTTGSGLSVMKSYAAVGNYTVYLTALNPVNSQKISKIVQVLDSVAGLSFQMPQTLYLANSSVVFAAGLLTGTSVSFTWIVCDTCSPVTTSVPVYIYSGFSTTGTKTVNVTAYNAVSSISVNFSLYVTEPVTSIAITTTLIDEHTAFFAETGVGVNFTAVANTEDYVTYTWSVDSVTINMVSSILYTYSSIGIFSMRVVASNGLSSKDEFIIVFVEEGITGLTVASNVSSPVSTNSGLEITASITAGSNESYFWQLVDDQNNVQNLTTTMSSIPWSFPDPGTYTFTVTVFNHIGSAQGTFQVIAMDSLSGVAISSTLNTTHPYISNDTTISFSSIVSVGVSYTVNWTVEDASSVLVTQQTDPFTYQFVTSGIYTLKMIVTNPVSTVTVSQIIYVEIPVTSLLLSASTTLTNTSNSVLIEAIHNADASNLNYEWTVEGVVSTGSKTKSHVFTAAGVYTVYVRVYNNITELTAQLDIVVQAPISGLSTTGCDSIYEMGNSVAITGAVIAGTNVTYTWLVTTGTSNIVTITTNPFSYTFTAADYYTVSLNASNLVDSVQLTCNLTIIGPISNLQITTSSSMYFYVNYSITFDVTGINLVGVMYNFTFQQTGDVISQESNSLSKSFAASGSYTLEVTVYHYASSASVSLTFAIRTLLCDSPILTAGSPYSRNIHKSNDISFEVTVDTLGCTQYSLQYYWTIYSAGNCSVDLINTNELSGVAVNRPFLTVPNGTLGYGSYCLQLNANYSGTPLIETLQFELTVLTSDLIPIISSGSKLLLPQSSTITIDGQQSYDPDYSTTSILHFWGCVMTYSGSLPGGSTDGCIYVTNQTTSTVQIPSSHLTGGQVYDISLSVSSVGRALTSTHQQITISTANIPIVTISCLSCSANNNYRISPNQHLVLLGKCSNCQSNSRLDYQWTVEYDTGGTAPSISSFSSTRLTNANLVIEKGYFEDGKSYLFRLQITRSVGSGANSGSAELNLEGNPGPTGGSCTILSASVLTLSDLLQVSCSGWSDSDSTEIYYKVVTFSDTEPLEMAPIYYGTQSSPSVYVAPWPGTSRNTVNVTIYVEDEFGASVQALSVDVTVTSHVLGNTSKTDYLLTTSDSSLTLFAKQNNPSVIIQYSMALLHEINEESRAATGTTGQSTRTSLRNAICVAVLGLPVITEHDRHQMAYILEHLTKYSSEFQNSLCQNYVMTQMSNIKAIMKSTVSQGLDDSNYMGEHLMATISNVMTAVNAGYYSSSSTVTSTTLDSSLSKYIPELSTITITTSVSDESSLVIRKNIVTSAFNLGEEIMSLLLMTQVESENPITMILNGIDAYGKRCKPADIESNYQLNGISFDIPSTILNGVVSSDKEVFQIMMVLDPNPITWGTYNNMEVNSTLASLTFANTSGSSYSVSGLTGSNKLKLFLFNSNTTPLNITGNSLVTSQGYAPKNNMEYSSGTIKPSESVKVDLDTSQGYNLAAFHVQIDFEFLPSTTAPSGINSIDQIDVYLGKNIAADRATSIYEQQLELTKAMTSSSDHRNYTVFVSSSDFDTSATYTLTVYNDDPYYSVNITLGIYFSSCQYYNPVTTQWDSQGCEPLDESITTCSVCECNHLTAFGSSMLVPISAIDFTDILRIDIYSNPIAFITCSIMFIVYIVAVFVCRKMDQLDLDRISVVPLCGKDGSFKYEITVVTGRKMGAGTTAHVGIKLHGDYGKSKARHLTKKGAFQRNCTDSFMIAHDLDLGSIYKLSIWHDNYGLDPNWFLDHIVIRDLQTEKKYYFFAKFWMSLEMENGFIQREIMAAGSADMQKFSNKFKYAVPNCVADRHLWVSLLDRPAHSRLTRVQRATVGVTLIYSFMFLNAMWYGLIKQDTDTGSTLGWTSFGWEEVVVALVTNVTVFPLSIIILAIFKKSRSQSNLFDQGKRADTAETIEIENACDASQYSSFRTQSPDNHDLLSNYDRESTEDSLVVNNMPQNPGLRRTRTLARHETLPTPGSSGTSGSKRPSSNSSNSDSTGTQSKIASSVGTASRVTRTTSVVSGTSNQVNRADVKLRRTNNPSLWKEQQTGLEWPKRLPWYTGAGESSPTPGSAQEQFKNPEAKEAADEIMEYLDSMEKEMQQKEKSVQLRRNTSQNRRQSETGTQATGGGAKPKTKRASMTSIGGVSKPSSAQSQKGFNPREEATIQENSAANGGSSNVISKWASKLRNTQSQSSINSKKESALPEVEAASEVASYGPLQPDERLASHVSHPDIIQCSSYEEMDMDSIPEKVPGCTLPSWFVYVGYVICFILCVFSVIMVFLYVYNFGPDRGLEWILALTFAFVESFLLIEPLKALFIAVYMSTFYKRLEQQDEDDIIDIEPMVDTSVERVKEVKFKPLGGFALINAREDGMKIQRMRLMLRQFVAYMFYLWLLMVMCYINFSYDTYVFTKHVESQYTKTALSTDNNFDNMSRISEVWTWSQTVLIENLHTENINDYTENGELLGIARLRQVRGQQETCAVFDMLGNTGLVNSSCSGRLGYVEDTGSYSEGWISSPSGNSSWQYSTDDSTGSRKHDGHVFSYGGGGYIQNLGSTYNESLTILQDLQNKSWIDLQTRAVFIEFTLFSPATDLTSVVIFLIEFPLTGAVNTSYEIQTQRLLRFVSGVVDPLMVCEAMFFLVVIYLMVHIVLGIRKEGRQFFTQFWHWFQILTTLMAVTIIGLYIGCVVEASDTFQSYFNNPTGFTNFQKVSEVHIAMRYTHAWLLFLLMFQIVKQVRFIKFLQIHVYEKTLSLATGKLAGAIFIFTILFLTHGMVGYLFYGAYIHGFEDYLSTLMTLLGMVRGSFNFWELLTFNEAFTHFYVYSFYIFTYGLTIGLTLAIVNDTYKTLKSQMFFKSTLDSQDYEMIDFMMKRFKLWAGITKPKPEFRKVRFFDQESAISSRCSSAVSRQSVENEPVVSSQSRGDSENHGPAVGRLSPTWAQVLDRLERVTYLDSLEDDLLKQTLRGIDEWRWQTRIQALEKERQSILTWKDKPPAHPPTTRQTATPHRTMTEGRLPRKPAAFSPNSDPGKNSKSKAKRPLSDQGGRVEQEPPRERRRSIYEFFKSIRPSKPAW